MYNEKESFKKQLKALLCNVAIFALALLFCFIISLLTSCRTKQNIVNNTRDSIRVEYREIIEIETDTQYIEIPAAYSSVQTLDTTSTLENDFSRSFASYSNGILFHSLEQLKQSLPVPVDKQIIYKDSIIYKDRKVEVEKIVEVEKKLSKYQKISIYGFNILIAVLLLLVIIRYRSAIFSLIRRFI